MPTPLSKFNCRNINSAFLALFERDGFTLLPSSSLLHPSVPMSFVMSAGLIQVENDLEQIVARTQGRFAFTQPCFRHFDVNRIGRDTTHLSLFHMSAAFHIGSSERTTVLPTLWHFMTKTLQLLPERLWITYLDDEYLGCDEATLRCWQQIGVNEKRLVGLDRQHCFWQQREIGQIAQDGRKCGPHSEIFFERTDIKCVECQYDPSLIGTCNCGRFVEISNSLFIENYLSDDGQLIKSNTCFAECVIGAERLSMILQGVLDVLHVDRFEPIRKRLMKILPNNLTDRQLSEINIALDHLTAFEYLVREGAPEPGRGGRRYVMRKLARGAMSALINLKLDVEKVLKILVSDRALQWLLEEWKRFECSLIKRHSYSHFSYQERLQ